MGERSAVEREKRKDEAARHEQAEVQWQLTGSTSRHRAMAEMP